MRARVGILVAVALGVVGATTPVVATEFVEYYKAGLAAVESGDWTRAEEMMSRAIDIQPKSKARVKKALFFKRYLPHYHLGRALYESGDCAGALAAWQEAERQGVVRRFPEYENLEDGRQRCGERSSEVEFSVAQAKGLIASAGAAGAKARQRLADLQATDAAGASSLSQRLEAAESKLRAAEDLLRQARGDVAKLEESASTAAAARDGFDSVSREAAQWLQSIASAQVQMRADLNQLALDGRAVLEESRHLEPYPPGIARRRSRVQELVNRVGRLDATVGDAEVAEMTADLGRALSGLRHSVAEPPEELASAARAFLNGRYSEVLEILSQTDAVTDRVSVQVDLLQAAALFALYHTQGGLHPELLEQARHEVISCRRAEVEVPSPLPNVFSPRFIEFFEAQQPESPSAAEELADS